MRGFHQLTRFFVSKARTDPLTLYTALGISPKLSYEAEKRPFYATKDGLGNAISELFS